MTELSFLIELLLNHDLPKPTKDLIAERIKEVEQGITSSPRPREVPLHFNNVGPQQAASTLKAMAKHGDIPPIVMTEIPPVVPVEQVAQTPMAAAAVNHRNTLINKAVNQNREMVDTGKGTKGPRKW